MTRPQTRPARRPDVAGAIWAVLASPAFAVPLLAALALLAAAGALLGPGSAPDEALESGWIALPLAFAGLAAAACAAEGLPRLIRVMRHPDRRLTEEVARGLRHVHRLPAGSDPAGESARVEAALRARGFRPVAARDGAAVYLFAQRGTWSRLGPWVASAGLLLAFCGGVAGRLLGFQGAVEVPPGGAFDAVPVRGPGVEATRRPLPFVVRVDDVGVVRGPDGQVRAVRPRLSLFDRGGQPIAGRQDRDVASRPLAWAGILVYPAGFREDPGGERALLAITDKASGQRQELRLAKGETVEAGEVRFSVEGYDPKFGTLGPAALVRRAEAGRTTEFWVFQQQPEFDGKNRPDRYALEFHGLQTTTLAVLRVASRPGAFPALWIGCLLVVAGLAAGLLGSHRRLWARVEAGAVVLAGSAHRAEAGLRALLADLRQALAGPGDGDRAGRGAA